MVLLHHWLRLSLGRITDKLAIGAYIRSSLVLEYDQASHVALLIIQNCAFILPRFD